VSTAISSVMIKTGLPPRAPAILACSRSRLSMNGRPKSWSTTTLRPQRDHIAACRSVVPTMIDATPPRARLRTTPSPLASPRMTTATGPLFMGI
jgi:hypothetical protein